MGWRLSLPFANGREPILRQPLLAQVLMKRVSNWLGNSIAISVFRPLSLETGRYFFTHFCSGKVCCLSDTDRESLRA